MKKTAILILFLGISACSPDQKACPFGIVDYIGYADEDLVASTVMDKVFGDNELRECISNRCSVNDVECIETEIGTAETEWLKRGINTLIISHLADWLILAIMVVIFSLWRPNKWSLYPFVWGYVSTIPVLMWPWLWWLYIIAFTALAVWLWLQKIQPLPKGEPFNRGSIIREVDPRMSPYYKPEMAKRLIRPKRPKSSKDDSCN